MPALQGMRPLLRIHYYDLRAIPRSPEVAGIGQACRIPGVGTNGSRNWRRNPSSQSAWARSSSGGSSRSEVPIASAAVSDEDFRPRFEQKGVDMRLGLDIAGYAADRSVDRVILVTGDTDCLPVMKRARTAGLQVVLVQFPKQRLARELLWHSDFHRSVRWPGLEARPD